MDILQSIRDKLKLLPSDDKIIGIRSVISHIEIAEKYFLRATIEKDDYFFTDVIYRTNHAFEGILKEAYAILTEKDSERKTPNDIEKYLAENNIFRPRVMELFKNYRNDWRNPATHDYKLSFTEQEAFLAIVTVSAFTSILIDQIIETINYRLEKGRTEEHVDIIINSIQNYHSLSLLYKLRDLFIKFAKELVNQYENISSMSEVQVIGLLGGFVAAVEPTFIVDQRPLRVGGWTIRPDLVFISEKEKVLIEIKRGAIKNSSDVRDQMLNYLIKSGIDDGIIFIPSQDLALLETIETAYEINNRKLRIISIAPKR